MEIDYGEALEAVGTDKQITVEQALNVLSGDARRSGVTTPTPEAAAAASSSASVAAAAAAAGSGAGNAAGGFADWQQEVTTALLAMGIPIVVASECMARGGPGLLIDDAALWCTAPAGSRPALGPNPNPDMDRTIVVDDSDDECGSAAAGPADQPTADDWLVHQGADDEGEDEDPKVVPEFDGSFLRQTVLYMEQRLGTLNEYCVVRAHLMPFLSFPQKIGRPFARRCLRRSWSPYDHLIR